MASASAAFRRAIVAPLYAAAAAPHSMIATAKRVATVRITNAAPWRAPPPSAGFWFRILRARRRRGPRRPPCKQGPPRHPHDEARELLVPRVSRYRGSIGEVKTDRL